MAIDYLTRYVEAKPVKSTDSAAVIDFLKNGIFARHGVVSKLISDPGTAYSSHEFENFIGEWIVTHIMASIEHPETNGLVNRTTVEMMAAYVNMVHTDWDEHIPIALFAMNTAKQATTKILPFELVYGRTAVTPTELAFTWPKEEPERREVFLRKVRKWRKMARRLILGQQKKSKKSALTPTGIQTRFINGGN